MLKIKQKDLVQVLVLVLEGRILLGDGEEVLNKTVRGALAEGRKRIVLNMKGVDRIDSAGLGVFAGLALSASRQHAVIKLAELSPFVKGVLETVWLHLKFDVYATEEEAVASFVMEKDAVAGKASRR